MQLLGKRCHPDKRVHAKATRKLCYSGPVQGSHSDSHLQAGSVQGEYKQRTISPFPAADQGDILFFRNKAKHI